MDHLKITPFDKLSELGQQYEKIAELGNSLNHKFLEIYCLYQVTSILSDRMDIGATLKVTKKLFQKTFRLDQFAMLLIDDSTQELAVRSSFGFRRAPRASSTYPLDTGLIGKALGGRAPVLIQDLEKDPVDLASHPGIADARGSILCLPLIAAESEEPLGAISLYRREPDAFAETECELFAKIATQVGKVLEKVHLYEYTRELSITDELTSIFNRRYFNQRFDREMQRSQRYNRPLSLLMIDIDHFKQFNDAHGHLAGDEILAQVAKILEKSLRRADIVARFGGEEFVVLLPEIDKQHAKTVAEKLRKAILNEDFDRAETQPSGRLTISLGLASFPEDASRPGVLLDCADRALYRAKDRGRNQTGILDDAKPDTDRLSRYRMTAAVPS